MSAPTRRVRCFFGDGRLARYPVDKPRWCGQRCAAEWAAQLMDTEDASTWRSCCQSWETDASHSCKESTRGEG